MSEMKKRILQFIKDYMSQHGYAPTVREIGSGVGLLSSSSVYHHLEMLLDAGELETDHPGAPRALRLPKRNEE